MNRAPIVLGSTAVGLGLVLAFHTHSPVAHPRALSTTTSGAGGSGSTATTTPPATGGGSATTAPSGGGQAATTTTAPPNTTRSATGQDIQYQYGDIQLKVTEQGSKITSVDIVNNGANDARSAQINSIAVPMLTQQALQVQSAQIDGVSGATFTSNAYAQALQSAIDQLH